MLRYFTPKLQPDIWGDGFADDGWVCILKVRHWDQLSRDEYFRYYPNLYQQASEVKASVLSVVETLLTDCQNGKAVTAGNRMLRLKNSSFVQRACVVLVLARLRLITGTTEDVGGAIFNDFAFLTGIHPGYLWPAALISHDEAATACWLGVIATGRRAFVPLEVADYLADIINQDGATYTIRSSQISDLADGVISARSLFRAATARQHGGSPVVRQSWMTPLLDRLAKGRSQYRARPLLPEVAHKESGNAHAL